MWRNKKSWADKIALKDYSVCPWSTVSRNPAHIKFFPGIFSNDQIGTSVAVNT